MARIAASAPLASHRRFFSRDFEEVRYSLGQSCCKHDLHRLSKRQPTGWLNAVELKNWVLEPWALAPMYE